MERLNSFDYLQNRRREDMVKNLRSVHDITDERVLDTMRRVPRHRFVPEALQDQAYDDHPLPIGLGQTISQPYIVALMTSLLQPGRSHKVLEIGTGSGYQVAVLAELCDRIFSMDRLPELTNRARRILDELGYFNVALRTGDGFHGWPKYAPYDRILVTAAAAEFPNSLLEQLGVEGILVAPVGTAAEQEIIRVKVKNGSPHCERICRCTFVPLVRRFKLSHDQ
jgi:protein-L-isoaspartate(D-aspartate) O-methyltransferase